MTAPAPSDPDQLAPSCLDAVSVRAETFGSQNVILPPYDSTARHFTAGAFFGITIQAGMPLHRAAQAIAAP